MTDSDTTDLPKTKLQPTHSHSPGTPPALKFVHECRASMYSFKRFVQKGRKKGGRNCRSLVRTAELMTFVDGYI